MGSAVFIFILFSVACMILVAGLVILWATSRELKPPPKFKEPECTGCTWGNRGDTDHN